MRHWAKVLCTLRVTVALTLMAVGGLILPGAIQTAKTADDRVSIAWRLACRLANYGKYQAGAWSHLASIGVHYVFISVPTPDEVAGVQKQLDANQLTPLVMRGQTDL